MATSRTTAMLSRSSSQTSPTVDWKKFSRSVLCGKYWSSFKMYRNKLNAALWPGSLLNMTVIVGGVMTVRFSHVTILDPIRSKLLVLEDVMPILDENLRMICSSLVWGVIVFTCLTISRRMVLRELLAFRQWMYEPLGKQSVTTVVWATLVKLLSGWSPSTYSYQSCLPRMSVPPLNETLTKLVTSLEPIFEGQPEKLAELKAEVKQFEEKVGYKLQRALVLRSFWCDNFVSDWWENYVYLMNRSPLVINSNYYIMDQCFWMPTTCQSARAAGTLFQFLLVREQLLTENFEPLVIRKCIPTCMIQYKRIFSTTRVPGKDIDRLVHYAATHSQHVVVSRRGLLYKIDVSDAHGQLLAPSQLEQQMEWIIKDADDRYSAVPECERLVPALTSQDRTSWAKAREEFFSLGVNKETLQHLESAVLFIVLDTHSFPDLSTRAAHLLHGDVGSFWFDKSVQLIVMPDGHMGLNCEHSYADAPVIGHIFEHSLTFEATGELYDADGHCRDPFPTDSVAGLRSKPTPLMWEVDERLEALINRACVQAKKNIDDLDLVVFDHQEFGKGAIKACRLSPDAFIQMALNTTYRKLTGTPVLTYEATMTRLFKHGRTETVRSLTRETNQFVLAFLDPNQPQEKKRSLLKAACEKHATLYKDAMNGKGIDRHLFALYVASRGLGLDCEFLKKVLSIPWTLSTSQQPQQQISWSPNCADPKYQHMLSPGGGFGPVAEDGYGVSYMVPGDSRIFFHVSSRRSGRGTNSEQFAEALKVTMADMIRLHGQNSG